MRKATIIAITVLAFPGISLAKPLTRILQKPCSVVFPAAESLASAKPYKLQLDGKTDMNLIVETGSFSEGWCRTNHRAVLSQ